MAAPRHAVAPGRRAGYGTELELGAVHPRSRLALLLLRTPGPARCGRSDRDDSAPPYELSPPPPLGAALRRPGRSADAGRPGTPRRADAGWGATLDRRGTPGNAAAF